MGIPLNRWSQRGAGRLLSIEDCRAIFIAAPDGYLVVDAEGVIRDTNPELAGMFGWTVEEIIGELVEVLVPGSLSDRHLAHRREFVGHPRDRPMGAGLDMRGCGGTVPPSP